MARNQTKFYSIVLKDGTPYGKSYANLGSAKSRLTYLAQQNSQYADATIVEVDIQHGNPLFRVRLGAETDGQIWWKKYEKPTFEKISEKFGKIEKNEEVEEDLSTI